MSKYLGKDERLALIAEFDQGKPCSNPYFYVMKNKKGIYNVKRVKENAKPKEEPIEEIYSPEVQAAINLIKSELGDDRLKIKKPKPPTEEVIMTKDQEALLEILKKQLNVDIKVPKRRNIEITVEDEEDDHPAPLKKDVIVPVKETVPEEKVEKPKAL
jgi:hypothetical protein